MLTYLFSCFKDKDAFVRAQLYDYTYDRSQTLPALYTWPEDVQKPFTDL